MTSSSELTSLFILWRHISVEETPPVDFFLSDGETAVIRMEGNGGKDKQIFKYSSATIYPRSKDEDFEILAKRTIQVGDEENYQRFEIFFLSTNRKKSIGGVSSTEIWIKSDVNSEEDFTMLGLKFVCQQFFCFDVQQWADEFLS